MDRKLWISAVAVAAGMYGLRRLGGRGGATDAEARASLPGDGLVSKPTLQTTHAISIDAPAAAIWPWLAQMGLYRAGWYADAGWWDKPINRYLKTHTRAETERTGYTLRTAPSAERIMPEFQQLKPGDTILDGPPGTAAFRVAVVEPARALVLYSDTHVGYVLPRTIQRIPWLGLHGAFSWSFVLDEHAAAPTRLLLRTRLAAGPPVWGLFLPVVWLVDYLTTRRQLRGIKRRAEQASVLAPVEVPPASGTIADRSHPRPPREPAALP